MTFGQPDGLAALLTAPDPETRRKARRERREAIATLLARRPHDNPNVIHVDFRKGNP